MTTTHTGVRKPITPVATLSPYTLKDNYGVGSLADEQIPIHGYADGAALKKQFLSDGCKHLKTVAQTLYEEGFVEYEVRAITGGPAVAGDVSATIWHKDQERWLHLILVGSASENLSPRRDRIGLLARIATTHDPQGLTSPTWWLSPMANSQAVAKSVAALFHGRSEQLTTSADFSQVTDLAPILHTANAPIGRPLH